MNFDSFISEIIHCAAMKWSSRGEGRGWWKNSNENQSERAYVKGRVLKVSVLLLLITKSMKYHEFVLFLSASNHKIPAGIMLR